MVISSQDSSLFCCKIFHLRSILKLFFDINITIINIFLSSKYFYGTKPEIYFISFRMISINDIFVKRNEKKIFIISHFYKFSAYIAEITHFFYLNLIFFLLQESSFFIYIPFKENGFNKSSFFIEF